MPRVSYALSCSYCKKVCIRPACGLRSVTPPPAVVEVNRTWEPFAEPVDQPVNVPVEEKLSEALGVKDSAERLENAAATWALVMLADAVNVIPATVNVCPAVIAENVTRAFSVTAALLFISDADIPKSASLIAATTPAGVSVATLTVVSIPG